MMNEVSVREISDISRLTALFYNTNKIKMTELADAETNPTGNLQDNGATPPVTTQTSSTHSPLEDTFVAPAKPPSHPHVEYGDADLQGCAGDLPDVHILGYENILFGIYQYWVHKNQGYHLDGIIREEGK